MVWDVTGDINVTVDYFNIEIQDRIAATGTIDISSRSAIAGVGCPAALAAGRNLALCLQEAGVPGAADLSSVSFYTNDFSTTTQGVDLVATWNLDFGDMGNGTLNAAWNWTETEVDNAGQEVNRNRVVGLENQNPQNRGVFTYNHFLNDFRFLARLRTYDDWIDSGWSGDTTSRGPNGLGYTINCGFNTDNCYSGESVVDLEAAYTWNSNYTFVVGANNAFDQDAAINQNNLDGTIGDGSLYAGSTPWGTEGAFYYARVRVDF
jgi:iron complex outermembrane receptor protein